MILKLSEYSSSQALSPRQVSSSRQFIPVIKQIRIDRREIKCNIIVAVRQIDKNRVEG